MAGGEPINAQARAVMDHLSAAYSSAFAAMIYVTDPARWPGFAAFAEQHMPPGEYPGEWTEADRLAMRDDARIISAIANEIDKEGGFAP
jgi:hypothetical protein